MSREDKITSIKIGCYTVKLFSGFSSKNPAVQRSSIETSYSGIQWRSDPCTAVVSADIKTVQRYCKIK